MNKIAIILLNYKQVQLTMDCIASLREMENHDCSIVVVDNNSNDDSCETLRSYCPDCTILQSEENKGFAAGCNIGIRFALGAGAEYVLLLNNDTIVDPQLVDILLEHSMPDTVTVPKIYYYDEPTRIWYAGGYIDRLRGNVYHYGSGETDNEENSRMRMVDFASGCCMMIPKRVLMEVPLMDENYFLYYEDVDYSLSFAKQNVKILFCPQAKLWHKISSSVGKASKTSVYYTTRNRFYLLKKYRFGAMAWFYVVVTRLLKGIKGRIIGSNERYIFTGWKAYRDKEVGRSNRL